MHDNKEEQPSIQIVLCNGYYNQSVVLLSRTCIVQFYYQIMFTSYFWIYLYFSLQKKLNFMQKLILNLKVLFFLKKIKMNKKLKKYHIVEMLNGYDSELDALDSDDISGNELEGQAENGNTIVISEQLNTFNN